MSTARLLITIEGESAPDSAYHDVVGWQRAV